MRGIRRRIKYQLLAGGVLILSAPNGLAQEHLIQRPEYKLLRLAEEQYGQGHYQMALQTARQARTYYRNHPESLEEDKDKAHYLQILSGLKLDEKGIADSAKAFIAFTSN